MSLCGGLFRIQTVGLYLLSESSGTDERLYRQCQEGVFSVMEQNHCVLISGDVLSLSTSMNQILFLTTHTRQVLIGVTGGLGTKQRRTPQTELMTMYMSQ